MKRLALLAASAALLGAAPAAPATDLCAADVAAWKAAPAPGVSLKLARADSAPGGALRLDFDFAGRGGWAAATRKVDLVLPRRWEIRLRLRGEAPPNDLELKLADASGENVWWFRPPPFSLRNGDQEF